MTDLTTDLLRALLTVTGRSAYPIDTVASIVGPTSGSEKQVLAYNLCDGSKGQNEIAKAAGLDPGNFSRSVSRWIEAGILFRLGEGRDSKLLHVYPLPKDLNKKKGDK
ncbi:MAG: hypothetical protein JWP50_1719 [Phenylobacterium sp.]|nr:hypothetical protein [Phenylobacterium sp.]